MRKSRTVVLGVCFVISIGTSVLLGQVRQRQAPNNGAPTRPPLTRDQREDIRDRREDVFDRREDIRDAQRDGGIRDRREDVRDRREDVRDRREDVRDRLEDRIDRNPRFARRLHDLVPPGTTPRDAISGFRSERQFFAALHASKNLNIPFNDLKTQLNTGENVSLGQAIHTLRPDLSEGAIRNATRKAEDQAADTENTAG